MRIAVIAVFLVWMVPAYTMAQVMPHENDTLNYLIVGFSFPDQSMEGPFKLKLAVGHFTDEKIFKKHIIQTLEIKDTKAIIRVPSFGEEYTWQVTGAGKDKKATQSGFYHFYTGVSADVDTSRVRLLVSQKASKYKDAYIFLDGNRAMYDMDGNPVWYLPNIPDKIKAASQLRDVKITNSGTITFIADGKAFEVDYSGKILWEGSNGRKRFGDSIEGYHHELTKLSNGHYMVLSFEPIPRKYQFPTDSNGKRKRFTDPTQGHTMHITDSNPNYGIIMEYDETGKLVWEWKAASFFQHYDLEYYKKKNGMPEPDVHQNSFYFDEKNNFIYVSYRNISQLLKISYPSGEVTRVYGRLSYYLDSMEHHAFCGQHSVKLSNDGNIYLFNNGCGSLVRPEVAMFKEPVSDKDTLRKIWEYPCPVEIVNREMVQANNATLLNKRYCFSSGGNAMELADSSFLISTNEPYNKIFIVSWDKELLWSAEAEKWHLKTNGWMPQIQYRASIIAQPEQMEKLIWSSTRK